MRKSRSSKKRFANNNFLGDNIPEDIKSRIKLNSDSKEFLEAEFTFNDNMIGNLKLAEESSKTQNTTIVAEDQTDQSKVYVTNEEEQDLEQNYKKQYSCDQSEFKTVDPNEQTVNNENNEEIDQDDLDDLNEDEEDENSNWSDEEEDLNDDAEQPKNDKLQYPSNANHDLNYIHEYNGEFDYENIPEFVDAQTLIKRYFEENTECKDKSSIDPIPSNHNNIYEKKIDSIKSPMTEIPEEGEGDEGPDKNFNPEQIFNSVDNIENSSSLNIWAEIQNTPMFGENDTDVDCSNNLFSNFLWNNEISDKKVIDSINGFSSADYIQMSSAKKNITSKIQLEWQIDEQKIIKIQSKIRQFLAIKIVKALKQLKYIKSQQVNISINKMKLLSWRSITKFYIMHRETNKLVKSCKYLVENNKDTNDPMYYQHWESIKDIYFIERKFRKCLFRKVREYLKTIPYEWRQSYVKLIDCKIYNREMNNRLKFFQNMQVKHMNL